MCCIGVFHGLKALTGGMLQAKRLPLKCDKWTCDECRPQKTQKLYARLMNGGLLELAKQDGFRSQYAVKLLTLTCPGKEYRNSHTPREAYTEMVRCYDKLVRSLKKTYGTFHYFRVLEFQQDGFPHFHVLLSGINIATKDILLTIRRLWYKKYKMGNPDIQRKKKGQTIEKAIKYIIKYMQKTAESCESFKKLRLYTASRGALEKIRKSKNNWILWKMHFKPQSQDDYIPHIFDFKPGICIDEIPKVHQRLVALADVSQKMKILG